MTLHGPEIVGIRILLLDVMKLTYLQIVELMRLARYSRTQISSSNF